MKYLIECQEVRTVTYEVEATSVPQARRKFIDDGGREVSDVTGAMEIADINPVK